MSEYRWRPREWKPIELDVIANRAPKGTATIPGGILEKLAVLCFVPDLEETKAVPLRNVVASFIGNQTGSRRMIADLKAVVSSPRPIPSACDPLAFEAGLIDHTITTRPNGKRRLY